MGGKVLVIISGKKGSGKTTLADHLMFQFGNEVDYKFKKYAFADKFKNHLIDFFDLNPYFVYGTDDDKQQPTRYLWENMAGNHGRTGLMTYREFMQYWGSEICRSLDINIHVKNCLEEIRRGFRNQGRAFGRYHLAVISDARFPNEIEEPRRWAKESGWQLLSIRLTRSTGANDAHPSETALDHRNDLFDLVIPPDVTIESQLSLAIEAIESLTTKATSAT